MIYIFRILNFQLMYIAYQVYNSILIFIFMYYHHCYYLTIKIVITLKTLKN